MSGLAKLSPGPLQQSALQWLFLRSDLPSREELSALPPLRRAVLAGLLLLAGAALALPLAAIAALEITVAGQAILGSGGAVDTQAANGMPVGQFDNIMRRPLFSRSRQAMEMAAPAVQVETPAPAIATVDLNLVLRGVFMDGIQTKAFLTTPDNPVGTWVAVNDDIAGWRLAEVRPNEVVVEARGERQTLQLSILAK
jgi:hypothetical protein